MGTDKLMPPGGCVHRRSGAARLLMVTHKWMHLWMVCVATRNDISSPEES